VSVDFRLLGGVAVVVDDRPIDVGHARRRCVLAALLLDANRLVPADVLIDRVWADRAPPGVRNTLSGYLTRLRGRLPQTSDVTIEWRHGSYLLTVDPQSVDVNRFRTFVDTARRTADPKAAAQLLAQGLAEWRGDAFTTLHTPWLDMIRRQLHAERMAALADYNDLALRLGRHAELLGDLIALASAHPLDERLAAQLMLALYHNGRQADALYQFEEMRLRLARELGADPGPQLQRLHRQILTADIEPPDIEVDRGLQQLPPYNLSSPGSEHLPNQGTGSGPGHAPDGDGASPASATADTVAGAPAQLPAPPVAFTGRLHALKKLDELLADVGGATVALGVISGTAGVGKTALAVHWSRQVREHFPDGQLYVDLRGFAPAEPLAPVEVLAGFLRAMGVGAQQIPTDLDRAAALYRTRLADRRMLVLLDNARSAEQVRPLLPGSPGCMVIVTSRDRLRGLVARDGARHSTIDVLETHEAHNLLSRVLGPERLATEPEATAELIRRCSALPLALLIAAAGPRIDRHRTITSLVSELADEQHRLTTLSVIGDEQSAVRSAFDLSYEKLDADSRHMFRLLSLMPGPEITSEVAASLSDTTPMEAARHLDQLASAHLISGRSAGRYAFHDLLRLYASERMATEESQKEQTRTASRLFHAYLATADAADRMVNPDRIRLPLTVDEHASLPTPERFLAEFTDHTQALAWLEAERANLLAVVRHTADHGPHKIAWLLAHTFRGFLERGMYLVDWHTAAQAGLRAAKADGDLAGQAAAYLSLAAHLDRQGDLQAAAECNTRALECARQAGWHEGEVVALAELGVVYRHAGRLDAAKVYYREALEIAQRTENHVLVMHRLSNLGNLHAEAGELAQAADYYAKALPIIRAVGAYGNEAIVTANLGECCLVLGRLDEAIESFSRAQELNRTIGARSQAGDNLRALASAHCDAGRYTEALEFGQAALTDSRSTGDKLYEANALNVVATAELRLKAFDRAVDHHLDALRLSRQIGVRKHEVAALIGLAHSYQHLGDHNQAAAYAEEAIKLARQTGYRLLEGPALTASATTKNAQGDHAGAVETANAALDVHRAVGYRAGEARTLLVLARALQQLGDSTTSSNVLQFAQEIFAELGQWHEPSDVALPNRSGAVARPEPGQRNQTSN
jgi:DNA-binding SARP family transcriptional activator/tetratricopeptide (TPR) repeat protein